MLGRLMTGLFVALMVSTAETQNVRRLSPVQMAGIRIWNTWQSAYRVSPDRKTVTFTWQIEFKNETRAEIDAFLVHLAAYVDKQRIWKGGTITVRGLVNRGVPHTGSMLPFEIADVEKIEFTAPLDIWRSNVILKAELEGATSCVNPDLHDPGHLYTRLYNSKWQDQVSLFKQDPSLLRVREGNGLSTMLMVFGCGAPATIQYVRDHGGNIQDRTSLGTSMMHMAALNGYSGVLDLAVKWGGDVNVKNKNLRTPLDKSIWYGSENGWKWLLKHGAKPHDAFGEHSTAWYAFDRGVVGALQDLIAAGVSPRMHDQYGFGFMHYAVENYRTLDFVHSLGLPVDDRNTVTGTTPLMYSQMRGGHDATFWRLKHGANLDLKDRRGFTVYDYAKSTNTLGTDRFFRDIVRRAGR